MADCTFCGRGLANNKQIHYRCSICGAVFCSNGNCDGSYGKGRNVGYCKSCRKSNVVKKM